MKNTQNMTFRELNTQADIDRHIRHRLKTAVNLSDIRDITDETANTAYAEAAEQALRQFVYSRISVFNNLMTLTMLCIDMVLFFCSLFYRIANGKSLTPDILLSVYALRQLLALVLWICVTRRYREPADLLYPSKAVQRCSAVLPSLYMSMPVVSFIVSIRDYQIPYITIILTVALPTYFSAVVISELFHEHKIRASHKST